MKRFGKHMNLFLILAVMMSFVSPALPANAGGGWTEIYRADFETAAATPEFISFQTNGAKPAETVEGTENKYAVIDSNSGWVYGGYVFSDSISSGEYQVSFDFSASNSYDKYGMVYLTDQDIFNIGSQYNEFMLLDTNGSALEVGDVSRTGGTALTGLNFVKDQWYTYTMTINKTSDGGSYSVTVTQKDDASNTATVSGTNLPAKALDRIMFGTAVKISVDNIIVKKYVDAPEVVSVQYFNGNGNKQFVADVATRSVTITFTEKMDKASLDAAVALNGVTNEVSRSLSSDGKTYTLTFPGGLSGGSEYLLRVTTAAKSQHEMYLGTEYTKTIAVDTGIILFDADYDKIVPEFISFHTSGAKPTDTVEGAENKYAVIDDNPGWTYGGYVFSDSISSGEYQISFDFSASNSYNNYGMVYLTDQDIFNISPQYNEFMLLDTNGSALEVGDVSRAEGAALTGLNFVKDQWYTYTMTINKTPDGGSYSVTVTQKDNASNTATVSGTNLPAKALDRIMFGTAVKISMDNISVKKILKTPEISKIEYLDLNGEVQSVVNSATAAVKIWFSEQMAEEGFADGVTLKKKDTTWTLTGTLSEDKKSYTAEISEILKPTESYTLEIASTLKSVYGASLQKYTKVLQVSDGNTLLKVDYDENKAALEIYDGSAGEAKEATDGDNIYMNVTTGWSSIGYSMYQSIPKTGGDYKIKFDFKDLVINSGTYVLALTQKDCLSGSGEFSTYDQFGLLGMNEGSNALKVAGVELSELTYEAGVWYSYELDFNRSTAAYTLKITDKADPTKTVTSTGTFSKTQTWGHGLYDNRIYDALKFYYDGSVSIDNIEISKAAARPTIDNNALTFIKANNSVETDKTGVSLNTVKIGIEFKEAMNPRVIKDKITLISKDNHKVPFTITTDGTKVILNLSETLSSRTDYTISVDGAAEAINGLTLGSDYSNSFMTKDKEFDAELVNIAIGDVPVTNISALADGEAVINATAVNTTGSDGIVTVIIAYYSESGSLLKAESYPMSIADKTEGTVSLPVTIAKPTGTVSVDIMCWESLNSVRPISMVLNI